MIVVPVLHHLLLEAPIHQAAVAALVPVVVIPVVDLLPVQVAVEADLAEAEEDNKYYN